MNSKQIILTSIIFIILIGAGWYYFDKFKPKTSNSTNIREEIIYKKNSKTIQYIKKYHPNGQIIKLTSYRDDGENINYINEYNENEKIIKITRYRPNSKNIWNITDYNENSQITKITFYENDGQTISSIAEYNPDGTVKLKETESSKTELEPKISISQAKFDEITKFIFSQNDVSLSINLSEKEKIEIEKNRKFYKAIFEEQERIKKYQNEIDDYNNKLNEIETKKNELKPQQTKLERSRDNKTGEIDQLKSQLSNQGKPFFNNPKITKLQQERREIIQQIVNVENEIGKLESKQKMYTNMLKNVETVKKPLDEDFEPSKNNHKKIVIDELNKIYQITD
jgi:DNA repair exonuclease SbcCD ATPase subunit